MTIDEFSSSDPDRDPVDVLADEFAARYRRGETPSISEYTMRYPAHAKQIQALFPSVALLEQIGSRPDGAEGEPQPESQGSLPPHHRIGDFEILREIGRGGMGVVYEAVQQSLHRRVALKVLNTVSIHTGNQAQRFEREARAAAQLHHTNIVPVFGVGEQDGLRYYVMQRIHGQGLDAVIAELARQARTPKSRARSTGPSGDRSVSARELAGVLISEELSRSKSETTSPRRSDVLTSSSATTATRDRQPAKTTLNREIGSLQNTDDVQQGSETPEDGTVPYVPSSLILRDEPTGGRGVRSSLVLRDEFPGEDGWEFGPAAHALTSDEGELDKRPPSHTFGRRYWRNIARIGMQVAAGLQYAHTQGTLHRDIKPANVLLDSDGTAWIADFGLAKVLEADNVTRTGDVVGTLRYMAPEQFQGEANTQSDIYSLGLTLYELLTLQPAYDETDRQKLIARKLTPHDPPSLRKTIGNVPRDLETIVLKCLAYEAGDRYQTAGAVFADLQSFLEDRPIRARQASSAERLWRWCRRNPVVASLSGTVAVLLLLTAGLTSAGYVQEKRLRSEADQSAENADKARRAAVEAQEHAVAAKEQFERIAQIAFQAFDDIGQSFVSDDVIGTIELEEEGAEEPLHVPAFSPETAAIMEKLRSSFDRLADVAGEDSRFLDYASKAGLREGELHLRLNQWSEAKAAFTRAIELHEEFAGDPEEPGTRVRLAKLFNGLSVALESLREWEQARQSQRRALELLSVDASEPEMRFELARTYYLMGSRSFGRGMSGGFRSGGERGGTGRDATQTPLETQRQRARRDSDAGDDRDGRRRGGRPPGSFDWERFERRIRENREHLQEAAAQFDALAKEFPHETQYRFWLARCYLESSKPPHRTSEADTRRAEAIAILEDLVQTHPDKPDYLYYLSEAYELSYRHWNQFWLPRFDRQSDHDFRPAHEAEQVARDLQAAVRVSDQLVERQPHVPGYAVSHLLLLMGLADVLQPLDRTEEAAQYLDRAEQERETLAERFPDMKYLAWMADPVLRYMRANLLFAQADFAAARDVLVSMVEGFEEFASQSQRPGGRSRRVPREMLPVYRLLAECHEQLGEEDAAAAVRAKLAAMPDEDSRFGRGFRFGRSPDAAGDDEPLRMVPATEPSAAAETIRLQDGFRAEVIAAEPLVTDPVDIAYDENGLAYVAEMNDYPYVDSSDDRAWEDQSSEPIGRIRVLEDTDGDGRYDRSDVFADRLSWPAGVACWKEGVYVAATPDLLYLKDTDGDRRADVRRVVFTGFRKYNVQAVINNLRWGLDHHFYVAGSGNGGLVTSGDDSSEPVRFRLSDFRFRPTDEGEEFELVAGGARFGNSFDDWGNRFLCNIRNPVQHILFPERYLRRNRYLALSSLLNDVAPSGEAVAVYRVSPPEPWRVINAQRLASAPTKNRYDAMQATGYVTSSSGVTIYRGAAYPDEFAGNAFVGEVAGNLVIRYALDPDGVSFSTRRPYAQADFLASTDNWFRPVNFANAPDGTLHLLDMYRQTIEHPWSLPDDLQQRLSLTEGRDRGRIYRLLPPEFPEDFRPPPQPRLGKATTRQLVAELANPNGWWRDTAHRLIFERQDPTAVPLLRDMLSADESPVARLHALWSLEGLDALTHADLSQALGDGDSRVQSHAVRLAEDRLADDPELRASVVGLAAASDPALRFQVALSLGEAPGPATNSALSDVLRRDAADRWMRAAVLSSLGGHERELLLDVLKDPSFVMTDDGTAIATELAYAVAARGGVDGSLAVCDALAGEVYSSATGESLRREMVIRTAEGLRRQQVTLGSLAEAGNTRGARLVHGMLNHAAATIARAGDDAEQRLAAIELLAYADFSEAFAALSPLLHPREPEEIQSAAVTALGSFGRPEVARLLIDRCASFTPPIQDVAVGRLLSRGEWVVLLFDAMLDGKIPAGRVPVVQQEIYLKSPSDAIRARAEQLFASTSGGNRQDVVEDYRVRIAGDADPGRGRLVYEKHCASCHKSGSVGFEVGPHLSTVKHRTAGELLVGVFDPNREISPNYLTCVIATTDGRVHTGVVVSETSRAITLRGPERKEIVIDRDEIGEFQNLNKSLMPEGMEKSISPRQMADLIAFITAQ